MSQAIIKAASQIRFFFPHEETLVTSFSTKQTFFPHEETLVTSFSTKQTRGEGNVVDIVMAESVNTTAISVIFSVTGAQPARSNIPKSELEQRLEGNVVDIVMAKSVNSTAISVSWKVRGVNLFRTGH